MKKLRCLFVILLLPFMGLAQDNFGFVVEKQMKYLPVENQGMTGTCWSFSTLSFLSSEAMRLGKNPENLSEMFIVRHIYEAKAEKYLRLHGSLNFAAGGELHDVVWVLKNYGIVPESAYNGNPMPLFGYNHSEMDKALKNYIEETNGFSGKNLDLNWKKGYGEVLDTTLGRLPESFSVNGKQYTAKSYFQEEMALNLDDYVEVSSFSNYPFYALCPFEVPDNWSWDKVYNVPVEELSQIVERSLQTGYTVAWASDVSEKYWSNNYGVAVVPEQNLDTLQAGTVSQILSAPCKEKKITQEMRQIAFDNWQTTDDHGMHIVGLAKDKTGKRYYYVKNSWGTTAGKAGFWYVSEAFLQYKTTCLLVNKNGIPKDIRKKMGI